MCGLLKPDSHDIDWFFQFPLTVQSVASDGVLQVPLQHISNHLLCGECRRMEETLQAMCCPEAVSSRGFPSLLNVLSSFVCAFHLTTPTVTKYFLWYQVILKDVDSLLYVDTDVLFLRPMDDIWKFLKAFNSTQLAAMAPEHEIPKIGWYSRFARHPFYGVTGVNSGVMLMNLTRIRSTLFRVRNNRIDLTFLQFLIPNSNTQVLYIRYIYIYLHTV